MASTNYRISVINRIKHPVIVNFKKSYNLDQAQAKRRLKNIFNLYIPKYCLIG